MCSRSGDLARRVSTRFVKLIPVSNEFVIEVLLETALRWPKAREPEVSAGVMTSCGILVAGNVLHSVWWEDFL